MTVTIAVLSFCVVCIQVAAAKYVGGTIGPCTVDFNGTASGEGLMEENFNHRPYCAYRGIRYAHPPVGERRFEDPELLHPSGHQEYLAYDGMCAQFDNINGQANILGSEDCLFLSIYSPLVRTNGNDYRETKYPVLVFVHGGSYAAGNGEQDNHGVDLLMDNEVLVVTFNYRLYALGFLKHEKLNISGNFGLKDQLAALEWVQRYVKYFGGDPQRVTVMGSSAGAGSVTAYLYFEQAKGLFHNMVVLSGSMLAPWAMLYYYEKCTNNFLRDLDAITLDELKQLDYKKFFRKDTKFRYSFGFASMFYPCFVPTLEEHQSERALFKKAPHELVLQKPIIEVPMLISETSEEFQPLLSYVFGFWMSDNYPNNQNKTVKGQITSILSNLADFLLDGEVIRSKRYFYQSMANMANLFYPIKRLRHDLNKMLSPATPIYYLLFAYNGKFGKASRVTYADTMEHATDGAIHGDDLGYIFSPYNLEEALANRSEFKTEWSVHIQTVELMANFVKFGNPTPKRSKLSNILWPAYNQTNNQSQYLRINDVFTLQELDDTENMVYLIWHHIYECLYYYHCDQVFNWRSLIPAVNGTSTESSEYVVDEEIQDNVF